MFAAARPDNYTEQKIMQNLVSYLQEASNIAQTPTPLIILVVNGLHMPSDAMPVWLTDEEISILTIWGNLSPKLALIATPDPQWFPEQPAPNPLEENE